MTDTAEKTDWMGIIQADKLRRATFAMSQAPKQGWARHFVAIKYGCHCAVCYKPFPTSFERQVEVRQVPTKYDDYLPEGYREQTRYALVCAACAPTNRTSCGSTDS